MALVVEDHCKRFGKVEALKSLSFRLEPGNALALLGPNGAGKSTAVKILVSLLRADGGSYAWDDCDLFADPPKIRDLIGYVSQEIALDKILTGAEFMRFSAGLLHLDWKTHRDRAAQLLETMGLAEAAERRIGEYSGGMKRRLDLAAALLNDPRVLILDEPTTGLDIEAREHIWDLIRAFMKGGGALILASHDFREVAELADEVLVLDNGSVVLNGKPDALRREVGDLVIRVKTSEFMKDGDKQRVRAVFASWADSLSWYAEEKFASFVYRGPDSMNTIQNRVLHDLEEAGLPIFSVSVRKPDIEDVYRRALEAAA